jgi:hypothetical protein
MNVFDFLRKLFGMNPTPPPDQPVKPHDPCDDNAVCVDARTRLKAARSAITPLCDGIRIAKAVAAGAASILFSPWMAVAIVVAIAAWVIFGGLAGAAVVALLALYATLMLVYLGALAVLLGLTSALAQRQLAFANALQDVLSNCSPQCQGDLSQPVCNQ